MAVGAPQGYNSFQRLSSGPQQAPFVGRQSGGVQYGGAAPVVGSRLSSGGMPVQHVAQPVTKRADPLADLVINSRKPDTANGPTLTVSETNFSVDVVAVLPAGTVAEDVTVVYEETEKRLTVVGSTNGTEFRKSVTIAESINGAGADLGLENGELEVTFPKM